MNLSNGFSTVGGNGDDSLFASISSWLGMKMICVSKYHRQLIHIILFRFFTFNHVFVTKLGPDSDDWLTQQNELESCTPLDISVINIIILILWLLRIVSYTSCVISDSSYGHTAISNTSYDWINVREICAFFSHMYTRSSRLINSWIKIIIDKTKTGKFIHT